MLLGYFRDNLLWRGRCILTCIVFGSIFLTDMLTVARAIEPDLLEVDEPSSVQEHYIDPISDDEPYSLVVIGDSISNGLWHGLTYSFRSDNFIKIVKKTRSATGLVREDYYDWPRALEEILQGDEFHIAVVLFGTNDRQAIRTEDGVYRVGTQEWQTLYRARVDRIMEQLKAKNIAIYWVGLPIMRSPSFARHADLVNRIIRESATTFQVKFIETWRDFADDRGRYNAYGTDISGRKRKLRDGDGIHMTALGDRKLASAVEQFIRRDLDEIITTDSGINEKFPILPTLRPQQNARAGRAYVVANNAD